MLTHRGTPHTYTSRGTPHTYTSRGTSHTYTSGVPHTLTHLGIPHTLTHLGVPHTLKHLLPALPSFPRDLVPSPCCSFAWWEMVGGAVPLSLPRILSSLP